MKKLAVAVVVVAVVAGSLVGVLSAGSGNSPIEETAVASGKAKNTLRPIASSPAKSSTGQAPLIASTQQRLGTFRTESGEQIDVFLGDLSPGFKLLGHTGQPALDSRVRACVWTRGEEFSGLGCRAKPLFGRSTVKFSETAAGGPSPSDHTEYFISGVASPLVSRIEAITSSGESLRAELSAGRAFFVQLSSEQLARDVLVTDLRIYGADGSVIEDVDLQR